MPDWRARLQSWAGTWDQLSELTQDCFPLRQPAPEQKWPAGLPDCPALVDFYVRCGGGTFGEYELVPISELEDPSQDSWLADSPGLDLKPGRCINFGSHEYGHAVLWDADADEVFLYSPDDMEPDRLQQSMDEFLKRLFFPPGKSDSETIQMWTEALAESDQFAK